MDSPQKQGEDFGAAHGGRHEQRQQLRRGLFKRRERAKRVFRKQQRKTALKQRANTTRRGASMPSIEELWLYTTAAQRSHLAALDHLGEHGVDDVSVACARYSVALVYKCAGIKPGANIMH
jgi:hypothetical protein